MMKHLSLFLLFSLSSFTFADDVAIERYVNAKAAVLEAQVAQLLDAIFVLDNEDLSQETAFDKIGQPSFKAVDDALQNHGYSHNQYYQFEQKNEDGIAEWLTRHTTAANHLSSLEAQTDELTQDYDQLIKRLAAKQ